MSDPSPSSRGPNGVDPTSEASGSTAANAPAKDGPSALDAAFGSFNDALEEAKRVRDAEQEWLRRRSRLFAAFDAAADYAQQDPGGDFAATWALRWWEVICAMRELAGIRSIRDLTIPEGRGYAIASQILDRGLGETGSLEQVKTDLQQALKVMLPRFDLPAQEEIRRGVAPSDSMFNTPHDRLPPEDRAMVLRSIFQELKLQVLRLVDAQWADRVPAARARGSLAQEPKAVRDGAESTHTSEKSVVQEANTSIVCAPDGTWLVVGERNYRFSQGNQAKVIRLLFDMWTSAGMKDGNGLSEPALGEAIGSQSDNFRVLTTFHGNPALGVILRAVSRGVYALYLNADPPPEKLSVTRE